MSWSNGFFSFGVSWGGGYHHRHHGGWYGGGYRGPTVINTGDINIGNNINVGNRTEISNRVRNNELDINREGLRRDNLYNRPETRDRMADRSTVQRDYKQALAKNDLPNNVFSDRDGRVSRNVNDKWETREGGGWKPDDTLNRPATRDMARPDSRDLQKPSTRDVPSQQPATRDVERPSSKPAQVDRRRDLERAKQARNTGVQRERSRPASHRQVQQRPQNSRRR
jgi:hypothetical protein